MGTALQQALSPKPCQVAVQGSAVGAGLELLAYLVGGEKAIRVREDQQYGQLCHDYQPDRSFARDKPSCNPGICANNTLVYDTGITTKF